MSTSTAPLEGLRARRPFPQRTGPKGNLIYRLITTTDHKLVGGCRQPVESRMLSGCEGRPSSMAAGSTTPAARPFTGLLRSRQRRQSGANTAGGVSRIRQAAMATLRLQQAWRPCGYRRPARHSALM